MKAAQQREIELNAQLLEARQQLEQLVASNTSDASLLSMKRILEQMRVERTNVSFFEDKKRKDVGNTKKHF